MLYLEPIDERAVDLEHLRAAGGFDGGSALLCAITHTEEGLLDYDLSGLPLGNAPGSFDPKAPALDDSEAVRLISGRTEALAVQNPAKAIGWK